MLLVLLDLLVQLASRVLLVLLAHRVFRASLALRVLQVRLAPLASLDLPALLVPPALRERAAAVLLMATKATSR